MNKQGFTPIVERFFRYSWYISFGGETRRGWFAHRFSVRRRLGFCSRNSLVLPVTNAFEGARKMRRNLVGCRRLPATGGVVVGGRNREGQLCFVSPFASRSLVWGIIDVLSSVRMPTFDLCNKAKHRLRPLYGSCGSREMESDVQRDQATYIAGKTAGAAQQLIQLIYIAYY